MIRNFSSPIRETNGLMLGHSTQISRNSIGFSRAAQPSLNNQCLIHYSGDAHLMTVAPTGKGKGLSVLVPNLLTYPGPAVVFDPKGELYAVTGRRRREMGQKVYRLDPFEVAGSGTDSLNPLDIFKLKNADLETEAQMLGNLLSVGNRGVKDPFWDLNASGLHSGILAHLGRLHGTEQKSFGELAKHLMADDTVYSLALLMDTVGKQMPKMAYREISSFLQLSERDTRPGVLATAQSYIKPLHAERVVKSLECSTIPLQDVLDGSPLTIYINLPPDKLDSHKSLLKMWIGTLLKIITSRKVIPEQRTLFLLDEIAQVGNFPQLETAITLCRGYGLQCWTFWQDMSQLQASYPNTWRTILNNSGVVQTFGFNNLRMATDWADYLPFPASDLLSMDEESQVLMIPGREPQIVQKLDYLRDHHFRGMYDENPFHARRSLSVSAC